MKNKLSNPFLLLKLKRKLLISIMRLMMFFICVSTFGFAPLNILSQNVKIENDKDQYLTVDQVFRLIKSQTDYRFIYRQDLFEDYPKVFVKKGKIKANRLLQKSLSGGDLVFELNQNNTIFIKEKPSPEIFQQTITGKISDKNGVPLPGVTILIKGTNKGTSTDFDGNFTIDIVDQNAVLVISFIGFKTREITLNNRTRIDLVLEEDHQKLDEVVLVGYGAQKRENVTSAIVSVDEDSFNNGNINDSEQLLAGKVAGLTVSKIGGSPTGGIIMRLRGITSFGANSEPLIVIDGVVGGNLNNIDPNDIESFEVLKDASAGAIYGTRGSSGVIIVTTKSGTTVSEPTLNINSYTVFERISQFRQTASIAEFLENNGTDFGYRTDWLDEVAQTSNTNVINAAYSNNNDNTIYRASINYRDIEGVIKGEKLNVLNSRLNIIQNLFNDHLKLTGIMSLSRTRVNGVFGSALRQATYWNPTAPVYVDNDPSKGFFETNEQAVYNPVAMNAENTQNRQTKNHLINFKADLKIIDGLTLSANYSYQNSNTLNGFYSSANSLVGGGYGLGVGQDNNGRAERNTYDGENELYEFTTSYKNKFRDLEYTLLAGYSSQKEIDENFYATNTDFITGSVLYNNLGLGQGLYQEGGAIAAMGSYKSESLLVSYFGRANFTFKNIYNLALSYRREASSRFGSNNRWGDFWAISGSANLSEQFDWETLDNLKLRAGYGVTGNIPNERYAYLEILDANPNNLGFVNGQYVAAVEPVSNPNPDLKWEEKGELNIGMDFSVFQRRINGSFDYYIRKTSNLLNVINVPSPPNLFPSSLVNLGKLETKGFEVQLNAKIFTDKDFKWNTGIIFDTNKTKLIKFNNLENSEFLTENLGTPGFNNLLASQVKENEVIGNIMAPKFSRFNEENKALVFDVEGNEILASDASSDDFIVAGNGLPDFNLNWNNTLQYKNFDLNFLWRGVFGHSIANLAAAKLGHPGKAGMYRYITEGFFNPDDTDDSVWHSEYVEKGSFMKLDNLSLGYTINHDKNSIFKSFRLYVSGNNLITITKYSGPDPEPRFTGNSGVLAPGYDRLNNYLPTRSISLGLNINF